MCKELSRLEHKDEQPSREMGQGQRSSRRSAGGLKEAQEKTEACSSRSVNGEPRLGTGARAHWDGVRRKKSQSVTSVGEDSEKLEPNAVLVGTECCGRWARSSRCCGGPTRTRLSPVLKRSRHTQSLKTRTGISQKCYSLPWSPERK